MASSERLPIGWGAILLAAAFMATYGPGEDELRKQHIRRPIVEANGGFKVALIDDGEPGWALFRAGTALSASSKKLAGLSPATQQ